MDKVIFTPLEMHAARDAAAYELKHVAAIAKMNQYGYWIEIHDSLPVKARIDRGRWISDCECGAGNAVHPEWNVSRCFACGAVHTVKVPRWWRTIEKILLARSFTETRGWNPGETVAELRKENADNGLGKEIF